MSVVNVRVENKRGFEQMLKAFRRACSEHGVLHELKKHEYYEKPSEKRRKRLKKQRQQFSKVQVKR